MNVAFQKIHIASLKNIYKNSAILEEPASLYFNLEI